MTTVPFLLHAMSPLHAGTGQSVDVIDLPIARMRSTGVPIVPGSTIKGVLRDACREPGFGLDASTAKLVFGPDFDAHAAHEHAGALVASDARLLALPVRSFRGTFAFVSSPWLLSLAARDLEGLQEAGEGLPPRIQPQGRRVALVGARAESLVGHASGPGVTAKVYLEDLDLPLEELPAVGQWGTWLASRVFPGDEDAFSKRFVVVDDDTMTFLWETATQVDTRVRIQPDTRTVARGALWVEESLPPETILVGLLSSDRNRRGDDGLAPSEVLARVLPGQRTLQFGGKATVGRGRCRMLPLTAATRSQRTS